MVFEVLFILAAYLLGSVPFGYLFTKYATGQNILQLGSMSIGSTNVERVAGKKIALLTQVCDMLKGLLPVGSAILLQREGLVTIQPYFIYLIAFAAILGHNFSLFLKLKGGKGVNTTLGASILLAPIQVLVSVALFYLVKRLTKYVSVGSICLGISLPLTSLFFPLSYCFYYLLAAALLIIIMHIPNIRRLVQGNENASSNLKKKNVENR
ncbi:glycerol-3-phosphate 1-O-acyltransferase PlsY [Bacteroides sedimenti]|uniref:Glycerol-3-phosphate acyltransferase n=1 Tax=Bacteroides sedimenti TaxID=2136147 RepID=A0ABM8I6Y1_9BACE